MKNIVACLVLLALTLAAAAVEDRQVMYFGGTVSALAAGTVGRLDTTSQTSLTFEYASNKLEIPYAVVESYQYSTEVAHHLGVLPAIAVGLLKKRERRHFFRISYRDAGNLSQVAVFEVSKRMPRTLQAVLDARAPGKAVYGRPSPPKDANRPPVAKDQAAAPKQDHVPCAHDGGATKRAEPKDAEP